jgi:hypothetical protein
MKKGNRVPRNVLARECRNRYVSFIMKMHSEGKSSMNIKNEFISWGDELFGVGGFSTEKEILEFIEQTIADRI